VFLLLTTLAQLVFGLLPFPALPVEVQSAPSRKGRQEISRFILFSKNGGCGSCQNPGF